MRGICSRPECLASRNNSAVSPSLAAQESRFKKASNNEFDDSTLPCRSVCLHNPCCVDAMPCMHACMSAW